MIPYFCVFAIVVLFTIISNYVYKRNKIFSYICTLASILIICCFAAFRAYTVGTDINVYGFKRFSYAGLYNSIVDYITLKSFGTEYLYHVLNYIVYKTSHSFQLFLFILQLIPVLVVYRLASKNRTNSTYSLYIICYLFIWFNSSLNILRQTIAIFIVLYAYNYIEQKKYLKYIIFVLIASLFHSTALICLLMPCMQIFSNRKNKFLHLFFIVVILFFSYFTLDILLKMISTMPILNEYQRYITYNSGETFSSIFMFVKLIFLILNITYAKYIEKNKSNSLLIYYVTLDFVLYCSSAFIDYGYRISYYFLPYWIMLIPKIDFSIEDRKVKSTYRLLIAILLVLYWVVRFVICKYDGTIPYKFYEGRIII